MVDNIASRLKHTEEYYFSKKLREIDEMNKQGTSVINLGIGSPDMPPHPDVIKVLQDQSGLSSNHAYQSYKGSPILREAIANWYKRFYAVNIDPDKEVLPLMGSKEGILHICMTYLEEGDEALIPNPGYPTYGSAVRLSGATAVSYDLSADNGWLPDIEELEMRDLSRVKLMWINYPNMPTGAEATADFFNEIIQFGLKNNILICHDNPYSFILTEQPKSILTSPGALDISLELNSLSKSFNMAGWRVGMLIANQKRINEVLKYKSNMDSGMFLPVQLAATKALSLGQTWYDELNRLYRSRCEFAYEILKSIHCTYSLDQVGLFVWARIPTEFKDGYELSEYILQKSRVFITPGGIFGDAGNQYVRISLCANDEKFANALERIIKSIT